MQRVTVSAIDPDEDGRERDRRVLTGALDATDLAINHYTVAPGERISGLHGHGDQEEVFLVVEGEATVEHYPPHGAGRAGGESAGGDGEPASDDGRAGRTVGVAAGEAVRVAPGEAVRVAAGEAVRVAPGEYQSVRNDAAAPLVCYALGAPPGSEDVRIPLACPDCGHGYVHPTLAGDGGPVLACPDCGGETPVECPDCGGTAMRAVLGEAGEPVSVCEDCGYASKTL